MVHVKKIDIETARSAKRIVKPSKVVQEYLQILTDLQPGKAGQIDAKDEGEKPASIKNRIVRIAKAQNMSNIKVRRLGDKIMFWKES